MNKFFVCVAMAVVSVGVSAAPKTQLAKKKREPATDLVCFGRAYTAEHLKAHKGQTLRRVVVKTNFADWLSVEGVAAADGKTYQFSGSDQIANTSVLCAGFSADGDEQNGCVNAVRKDDTLTISPVAINYKSGEMDMSSKGLVLIRCEGKSSDGEGCEAGKLRKITLSVHNAEDSGYLLTRTACN